MQLTKSRAFLGHLVLSLTIVGTVCLIIFFFWYPGLYFQAKGAWQVLRVLLGVDLVVGPILTLYLYRPGKRGLKIDMTFIAVTQLAALIYGTATIFIERPYFVVFAVDRFEVIARRDVDLTGIDDPRLLDKPLVGPIAVVANRPDDQKGMQQLLDDVLFEGKPDIERRPELWAPYEEQTQVVAARARPLRDLADARPAARNEIERVAETRGCAIDALGYLPLVGRNRDFTFVVDKTTGALVDLIDVDPWLK